MNAGKNMLQWFLKLIYVLSMYIQTNLRIWRTNPLCLNILDRRFSTYLKNPDFALSFKQLLKLSQRFPVAPEATGKQAKAFTIFLTVDVDARTLEKTSRNKYPYRRGKRCGMHYERRGNTPRTLFPCQVTAKWEYEYFPDVNFAAPKTLGNPTHEYQT